MRLSVLVLFLIGTVTTTKSDRPVYSVWAGDVSCGGLRGQIWSDTKGWHDADCMELATKLSELRDVRGVSVMNGPDVPQMLAFSQYENEFRISGEDFREAQKTCRDLLKEGFAHPDILAQCRKTVTGIVPYGLKLK